MPASISDIRLLLRVKQLPRSADPHRVFITGGTGYVGSALIPLLLERGHRVRALVRSGSHGKVPSGCEVISGNALDAKTYQNLVKPSDTFVHLIGVPHPSPSKAAEFRSVDLVSTREAVKAASEAGVSHFVYLSVAQPAPLMKAYVAARAEGEALIRQQRPNATFLRPWYVLGHGHRWPYLLLPFYKIMEFFPPTRPAALRLGLVTLDQMVLSLVQAVETPPAGLRTVDVPQIRSAVLNLNLRQPAKSA